MSLPIAPRAVPARLPWEHLALACAAAWVWVLLFVSGGAVALGLAVAGFVSSVFPLNPLSDRPPFFRAWVGLAAGLLLPPECAALVAGAGPLLAGVIRRQEVITSLSNTITAAASAAVAAQVLFGLGWDPARPAFDDSHLLLAVIPAAVAAYAVHGLVEAGVVGLQTRGKGLERWVREPGRVSLDGALAGLAQVSLAVLVAGTAGSHTWMLVLLPLPAGAIYRSLERREQLRLQAEAELAHRATHDFLTGLPNRAHFVARLEAALDRSRHDGSTVVLFFVDFDAFKGVNDRFGHHEGDQFLVAAANRLRERVRRDAALARYGGDEFTVLVEGIPDWSEAQAIANSLAEELCRPFVLGEHGLPLTASVGVALSEPQAQGAGDMLRRADVALYQAKALGGAGYVVFGTGTDLGSLLWSAIEGRKVQSAR